MGQYAVIETQQYVGLILVGGVPVPAGHCRDRSDPRPCKGADNVQVVDAYVQYHPHVGDPFREGTCPNGADGNDTSDLSLFQLLPGQLDHGIAFRYDPQ